MLKFSLVFAAIAFAGCASERLYVNVVDNEGNPISNATVNVGFTSCHVVFADGKSCDYEARTGEDGNAVVRFNGDNSDVYWSVKADGYYPSDTYKEKFKIDVVQIPPAYYNVIMLEHEMKVAPKANLPAGVYDELLQVPIYGRNNKLLTTKTIHLKFTVLKPKRTVTVSNDGNGTASFSPAEPREGDTVTLTAAPKNGYVFDKWVVQGGGVTIDNVNSRNAMFTVGSSNVSVQATFKEIPNNSRGVQVTTDGNGSASKRWQLLRHLRHYPRHC